jgi:hypothetical protein
MASPAHRPKSSEPRPPGRERRQHPRASGDCPLFVSLTSGKELGVKRARLRDVSRAGVSFYMDKPIAVMSLLAVDLELPVAHGVRHVRGQGAVVRCERLSPSIEHYEIAVFLHEMAEIDRKALDEFVSAR